MERITYRGWHNAYKLSNGDVELIVLADVGPRIIWYSLRAGENQLHEVPADAGMRGGTDFRLYGGHRLWVSPEVPSTYYPDNNEVEVQVISNGARFLAPREASPPGIGLQKQMEVKLAAVGSEVSITHRITNQGRRSAHMAPWTPTMMRAGGRAILPLPPRAAMDNDHLQPVGVLGIWSYTDFTDSRWILGREFIQLRQLSRPTGSFPEQMTGLHNPGGWAAYFREGNLFVKKAPSISGALYPDYGCNLEVFTNPDFLEVETLAPLCELAPRQTVSHIEQWWLFGGVPFDESEEWIRTRICPLVDRHTNLGGRF
jgi:hypothetical protein